MSSDHTHFDVRVYNCLLNHPDSSADVVSRLINVPPKWFEKKNASAKGSSLGEKINSSKHEDVRKVERSIERLFNGKSIFQSVPGYPKRYSVRRKPVVNENAPDEDDFFPEEDEREDISHPDVHPEMLQFLNEETVV